MLNILVITPVRHIKNFQKNINLLGKVVYLEDCSSNDLKKIINNFDIIFTNPNKSKIYLNKEVIKNSSRLKMTI